MAESNQDPGLARYILATECTMGRRLPDGRILALIPLALGRWRVVVGSEDDRIGYQDGW